MSGLVGDSHQEALRILIDAYERVEAMVAAGASGPADSELAVLSAPMGWGKTRVVQEFYAHLAAKQPADSRYWPSELVADVDSGPALKARKKIEPGVFDVVDGTSMPFLWWAVSCQERQDARLSNAVADDIGQLIAHLGPALNKLEANKATRNAALGLARTLIAAAPFSDVPGILDGLDAVRTNIRDLFRAHRDRQRGEKHRIDPSEIDGSLIETWVGAIGSLLRTARIPMVVILDDAHWADPSSIEFVDELLERVPCLVVLTAWRGHLATQVRNNQPGDAGSLIRRWQDRLTPPCQIDRLSDAAAVEIAAAALGVEESHPLAAQLAQRAHGNPLLLRLWTELPLVQVTALSGTALDPDDLAELPEDARAEFQRRWRDLPRSAQAALAPASQYGTNFVPSVVAETLATADVAEQAVSEQALADAADPHWWIRHLTADTDQFTEPLLQEIAQERVREVLTARQRRDLNAAFVTCLARLRSTNEWTDLTTAGRRVLLACHVRLAQTDEAGDDPGAIVASYQELADLQPESQSGWTEALSLIDSAIKLNVSEDLNGTLTLWARKANLLQSLGRAGEALPVYERTLTDSEQILGTDHPSTLTSRNNLAYCLETLGRADEALPIHQRTLTDSEQILGTDHPFTLTSRNNLANCLRAVGRADEALPIYQRTLTDREQIRGTDHPDTLASRFNLAGCLETVGRADEALPVYERTLTDSERILGTDHPSTMTIRNNHAVCLRSVGRADEALSGFERTLTDRERVLGTGHPDTLASRNNLAVCLEELARPEDAKRVRAGPHF